VRVDAGTADGVSGSGGRSPLLLASLIAAWVLAIVAGFDVLYGYASAAGADATAPAEWPARSALPRATDRPTLAVFVHPNCACSRATLGELGRLLARVPDRVRTLVVISRPEGLADEAASTELRERARAIPGVRVIEDASAVEVTRFGATTSGSCLLYDARGALAFAGGITATRGHEGDSLGQDRIVSLITTGSADGAETPVFGCSIAEGPEPGGRSDE